MPFCQRNWDCRDPSFGSTALLPELDTTLKQFPTVTSTVYSFDGDVRAFYEWLQMTPPAG